MRKFTTKMLAAAGVAALLAFPAGNAGAQDMPGAGTTIDMARASWDTGWFQAEVYAQIFEELGYTVDTPVTLDNPVFYLSVAQGDVDLWVNGWFPLHNTYEETFSQGAEVIGYVEQGGALEGYLIDKASADEFGITSLEDFKRPEVMEAFDRNGDGKADLVACPPGWGCELMIEHHLDAYDLRDYVNDIKAGYTPAMADAIAAYEQGESIFFYTWTPNWTVGLLEPGEDVVWIEVPFTSLPEDQGAGMEDMTTLEVEGCVAMPCNLGWPPNDIRPVANSAFLEANPVIETLLLEIQIPLGDIFAQNSLMFEGEDSDEDIERHAAEWIADNRNLVDGWLDSARGGAM